MIARVAAALIAALGWAGLAIQWHATFGQTHDLAQTLWILLRFFTIITNVAVAMMMTLMALRGRLSPFLLGGVTLAILLVGAVYMTLLRGMIELSGGALLADTLLHKVVPVLATVFWLAFAPKGGLRWRDPLTWALYPLAYFVYALVRGRFEGRYAYPFIDVAALGYGGVAFNALAIAAAFAATGAGMVALDWALGRALAARRATG